MSNPSDIRIHLPEPCHEDWQAMTPAEKGRHCKACDKVVRDFTAVSVLEAAQEVVASEQQVCGRFLRDQVMVGSSWERTWRVQPMRRVRIFLWAFLLTFSLSVWGFSEAEAQGLQPAVEQLRAPGVIELLQADSTAQPNEIRGLVRDHYDGSPIPYASILLKKDGEVVNGTISTTEGKFVLRIPEALLADANYSIAVSYGGHERMEKPLDSTSAAIQVFIDPSFLLEEVILAERNDFEVMTGVTVGLVIVGTRDLSHLEKEKEHYTNPLDDWIMMRNSEANQTGRW